ncbi:unnamed protein product [Dimorphilus gyrociliatus]|uniref:Protein KTI12 homolog n=1 Tax=Dimorphilus gyrociliatus TaxID=2664684 RepID=A0A7I8V5C3_9ANNE|nr:unnamed protein product [Dimorphilus gyrociliatus]
MPLIILSGFPSSGKSKIANELVKFFTEDKQKNVKLFGDDQLKIKKNAVYSNSHQEKEVRGNLKSFVQRHLSKDCLVILDSLNYIKGYRYELFCVTKSCQTPQCVIHVATSIDKSREWNSQRQEDEKYEESIFDGLVQRYECPDSMNRWDSPLITIPSEEKVPVEEIFEALYVRKPPPANMSTQSQPLSDGNFMQELDGITQRIVSAIIDAQKTSVIGDYVTIKNARDKVHLTKHFTLAELQRKRRQYISFTKTHPIDIDKIPTMFVHFINKID